MYLEMSGRTPPIEIVDKTQEYMSNTQVVDREVSLLYSFLLLQDKNRFVKLVEYLDD